MSTSFTLPVGWGSKMTQRRNTISQVTAAIQGSVYIPTMVYPVWDFEFDIPYLSGRRDDPTSGISQLDGLFAECNGRAGTFLFNEPSCNTVTAANFGTGDGSSQTFQLVRPLGAGTKKDIVQNLNGSPSIFNNGTLVTSGYSVDTKGVVTFDTAPADGHTLTWTGAFYFRLRFKDDTIADLELFFSEAYKVSSLGFESVIL